ncbi:MAG: nickel/cobalt transporter [Armatimonadota bacterium]
MRWTEVVTRGRVALLGAALAAAGVAGLALPAAAHPGDEAIVYHYVWLEAEPGAVSLQHATQVGGLLAQAVWSEIDADGSGDLSEAEQEAHARGLASGLVLKVGEKLARPELEAYEYPSKQQFFGGDFAPIKLRLRAPLPKLTRAGTKVTLQDLTFPQFTASFPMAQVYPTGVAASEPRMSEDGRTTEVTFAIEGTKLEQNPSMAVPLPPGDRLPNLALTANAPGNAPAGPRSLEGIDLGNAPIFPDETKILVAREPDEHGGEMSGVKGLLGKPLSPWMIVLGLLAALMAGAAHALTPGHGKSMVAAYLVGSRGTVTDAVVLGITVTITHTLMVYVLGALCLWLTTRIQAEVVAHWLGAVSGALVLGIGFWLFQRGLLAYHGLKPMPGHSHGGPFGHTHGHSHEHGHAHEHSHGHAHEHGDAHGPGHTHAQAETPAGGETVSAERQPPRDAPLEDYRGAPPKPAGAFGRWGVVGLGVASGIVPCTDALAILLAAVNLGSIGIGLAIIAAFSVGMAAVLVALGVLMVTAKDFMARFTGESRWIRVLPAVSGAVLFFLGAWLTLSSLARAGIVKLG